MSQENKARLLILLTATVRTGGENEGEGFTGPLMVALHRYAASLAQCLASGSEELEIPVRVGVHARPVKGPRDDEGLDGP